MMFVNGRLSVIPPLSLRYPSVNGRGRNKEDGTDGYSGTDVSKTHPRAYMRIYLEKNCSTVPI